MINENEKNDQEKSFRIVELPSDDFFLNDDFAEKKKEQQDDVDVELKGNMVANNEQIDNNEVKLTQIDDEKKEKPSIENTNSNIINNFKNIFGLNKKTDSEEKVESSNNIIVENNENKVIKNNINEIKKELNLNNDFSINNIENEKIKNEKVEDNSVEIDKRVDISQENKNEEKVNSGLLSVVFNFFKSKQKQELENKENIKQISEKKINKNIDEKLSENVSSLNENNTKKENLNINSSSNIEENKDLSHNESNQKKDAFVVNKENVSINVDLKKENEEKVNDDILENITKKQKNESKVKIKNLLIAILSIVILALCIGAFYIYKNYDIIKKVEKVELPLVEKNIYRGQDFVTKVYPLMTDVVIVGDSYSFYLGEDCGNDLLIYANEGLTVKQLTNAFEMAAKQNRNYAFVFIGPNDFREDDKRKQTKIEDFKIDLQEKIDVLKNSGKTVLVSTYLKSEFTDYGEMSYKIKIKDYDKAVKEVCEEKEVTYVDLKDINDYHKNKRTKYDGQEDILHFNQEFNIKLVNILYSYIYDLELERRQNENKKN